MDTITIEHDTLIGYTGNSSNLQLPESQDGIPLRVIGNKVFLSCKTLTHLQLPSSVISIEDWGFAHAKNLQCLTVPANVIKLGKDVFLDCNSLERIEISNDTSGNPGTPYFLASAITKLHDYSLFCPAEAGCRDNHPLWMKRYDTALLSFLHSPDDYGFQPVYYGWFNDEDADVTQRPSYISSRKEAKIRATIERLIYPKHLLPDTRDRLYSYLAEQMPHDKRFYETQPLNSIVFWNLFLTEYIQDIQYLNLFIKTGCFCADNIPYLIPYLTDYNPEIIARLLRYQQETAANTSDAFNEFVL